MNLNCAWSNTIKLSHRQQNLHATFFFWLPFRFFVDGVVVVVGVGDGGDGDGVQHIWIFTNERSFNVEFWMEFSTCICWDSAVTSRLLLAIHQYNFSDNGIKPQLT